MTFSNYQCLPRFACIRALRAAAIMALLAVAMPPEAGAEIATGASSPNTRRMQDLLESAGLTVGFSHTFELVGGTHSSISTPLAGGLTDFVVGWQPKFPGLLGAGAFTAVYSGYSQTRTSLTPELQGISNLTAPSFRGWREAYFEMPLLRKAVRVKVGKVDANTEFAVVEGGSDLSNASAGVSPTLFTMPSYPDGVLSANVFVTPGRGLSFSGGVYRSIGGGEYFAGEAGFRRPGRWAGRIAAGVWKQRAGSLALDGMPASSGSYAVVEQTVIPRGSGRGLRAFARFSTADERVAPASLHNMYGASWTGFRGRDSDSAGFAFLHLRPALDGVVLETEKAFEVYYKFPLANHLDMKFDVQRVQRPGGLEGTPSFAVASVRLFVNFSTAREEQK